MRLQLSIIFIFLTCTFTLAQGTPSDPIAPNPEAFDAPQIEAAMTAQRITQIALEIDMNAKVVANTVELTIADVPVLIVVAPQADRMRAMVPISSSEGLSPKDLARVMQANFDTALDARYAIAQGRLWSVYIHPLSALKQDQFLSGLAQTVNLARTYGQTYSAGATQFGGGDSNGIYKELFEKLQKKGEEL